MLKLPGKMRNMSSSEIDPFKNPREHQKETLGNSFKPKGKTKTQGEIKTHSANGLATNSSPTFPASPARAAAPRARAGAGARAPAGRWTPLAWTPGAARDFPLGGRAKGAEGPDLGMGRN